MPFVLWVALLALGGAITSVFLLPRMLVLGLTVAAFYFGLHGLVTRLARWAAKYEDSHESLPLAPASVSTSKTIDAN
jgi:hypothetical protein